MQTEWQGSYLDGKTAARQQATIHVLRHGLHIVTESGATLSWPYSEIRQTQGFYTGEQVRLERGGETPEAILVGDPAFLTALHRVAPERAGRFHDPRGRPQRVKLTVLAAVLAVVLTVVLYVWGIPTLAMVAAEVVPVAWEESLGRAVVDQLVPAAKRCIDPPRLRALESIVGTLMAAAPGSSYTIRLTVMNEPVVNALAAPGGQVVVFRGLLERTRSAEELAGVLAHEIQHVLRRHTTRTLIQHASTGLLLAALIGDATGALAYGLETARTLGALEYSRRHEEEADERGMRMLVAAGIDPAGMVAFYEVLRKGPKTPELLRYFSSHPLPEERIARLRALVAGLPSRPSKLLPDQDWRDITRICARR